MKETQQLAKQQLIGLYHKKTAKLIKENASKSKAEWPSLFDFYSAVSRLGLKWKTPVGALNSGMEYEGIGSEGEPDADSVSSMGMVSAQGNSSALSESIALPAE